MTTRALGIQNLMTSSYRIAGALVAPLMLGGCGLPIGIQVASLLADGISVWKTDKTLTDHGLSAVTEKDCALWRGVEGKDICTDTDDAVTTLADASTPRAQEAPSQEAPSQELSITETPIADKNAQQDWGAAAAGTDNKKTAQRETPEFPTEDPVTAAVAPSTSLPSAAPIVTKVTLVEPAPVQSWKPVAPIPVTAVVGPAPKPKARPARISKQPEAAPARRTYYVIASYHRAVGARRFSRANSRLEPTILQGTAKGKRVFRVAIGPVAPAGRKTTKQFLKKRGFKDAWVLRIKSPKIITEVAALN